jgi:hypothetical protein
MEIGLIIYAVMMGICVVFVLTEYVIGNLKDGNGLKKWWRQNVVGDWKSNHPRV